MEQELSDALSKVLTLSDKGFQDYAKVYANAALENPYTGLPMEGEELKIQLLYVLNNLRYWKGYDAQITKDVLKKHAGIKVNVHGK